MERSPRRVLVVANPVAGLRRGRDAGEIAAGAARRAGVPPDQILPMLGSLGHLSTSRTRLPGSFSGGLTASTPAA